MEKKTMTVLAPDVYNEFHCIASACRNNCCEYPWQIIVDKKHYKLLRALREPKWLVDNFGQYFRRNTDSTGNVRYAYIATGERGCRLMTEDKMCRLHSDLGANYLCNTCRIYPRISSYWSDCGQVNKELSLAISCEEVARILYHKPEPIQFVATTEEYNRTSLASAYMTAANRLTIDETRPILKHYSLIRAVCIAVLQNRDYTVEQRLMLLAIYLDKLAQAEESGNTDSVPAMTDSYVQAVDERLYDQVFAAAAIPAVTSLLTNYALVYALSVVQEQEITTRCDLGITTMTYQQRTDNYRRYMSDKESFIEHMMVIEFFGRVLPFYINHSIRDCMRYLVSVYANFRFMLGGYLGEQATLTEVEFIDFIAFFGKAILHSSGSFDINIELLRRNNMESLAYMIAIIKG